MTTREIADKYIEIRGCRNKRSYKTRKDAKAVAKLMNRRPETVGYIRAYTCQFCDNYHIGHIKKEKNPQMGKLVFQ